MTRRLALLLPAAILVALASLAPVGSLVPGCAAAGSNHAVLVVEHGDGLVVTRCVAFDAEQVTGEQLLNAAGIAWSAQTFGGFGDAVCALDGEPAQYVDCPGKDRYWAVFVARAGGAWQLANVGISALTLHSGDAEGFRFVPASGVPVAPVSGAGVCAAPAATTTPTLRPTPFLVPTTRPPAPASPSRASPTKGVTSLAAESPAPVAAPTEAAATASTDSTSAAVAASPPPSPQAPTPAPSGGADLGLVAAAVAGGGLTGMALLRLLAGRRKAR